MNVPTIEVMLLSRTYFDHTHLLVASDDQHPVGFLHWLPVPERPATAVIANLAIPEHARADRIADLLLQQAFQRIGRAGVTEVLLGPAPEHWTGYAGAGHCGIGCGVPDEDQRVRRWAETAGFAPQQWLYSYRVQLSAYRPPFDRELLGMRRSATLDRRRDITDQPFRIASALSHLEVHRFVSSRRSGEPLARVDLLLGDPEITIVGTQAALVTAWQSTTENPEMQRPALRYTLVGAISELAAERTEHVETTVASGDRESQSLLESVGFGLHQRGTVYGRQLA
jgi:hypothetical protein